jgi:hypothetical protein
MCVIRQMLLMTACVSCVTYAPETGTNLPATSPLISPLHLTYVSIRQHALGVRTAASDIRQHTSAYVSILQHTLGVRSTASCIRQHTSAYVSIRQHSSAFVSTRQHTADTESSCSFPSSLVSLFLLSLLLSLALARSLSVKMERSIEVTGIQGQASKS